MNPEEAVLVKDTAARQYQLAIDGHTAFIDYKQQGKKVYLIHTEVPAELGGRGIAATLVNKTLTDMENNGEVLVPLCPYVRAYLKRHPEWNRLLAQQP